MYVCMHIWSRAREHACAAYVCGGHKVMLRVSADDLSTFSFEVELLSFLLKVMFYIYFIINIILYV